MGIGLSEYRAAIGAFARIAVNAGFHWRSKAKKKKSSKVRVVGGKERCEKGRSSYSDQVKKSDKQVKKRSRSLEGSRTRQRSRKIGQRSKTSDQTEQRERHSQRLSYRTRSQSNEKKRNKIPNKAFHSFKDSCVSCKTELFDQKYQRGRTRKREHQDRQCCSHAGEDPTKKTRDIEETKLHFLTSVVASGCLLLEQAIFSLVQMLLVRAGIETNPGPTSPTNSTCCNAFQHFKRVRNTIGKAKENFKSKVTQDTLTKKVIEIEETGEYFSLAINTE